MSVLIGAIPGVVAVLAVIIFFRGYHLLRSDPADQLQASDLELLTGIERERAEGQSLLGRTADRLGVRLRRALPDRVVGMLQRQIDFAGRPDGMSVDTLAAAAMRWLIILSPGMLLFAMQGQWAFILLGLMIVVVVPLAHLSAKAGKGPEPVDR